MAAQTTEEALVPALLGLLVLLRLLLLLLLHLVIPSDQVLPPPTHPPFPPAPLLANNEGRNIPRDKRRSPGKATPSGKEPGSKAVFTCCDPKSKARQQIESPNGRRYIILSRSRSALSESIGGCFPVPRPLRLVSPGSTAMECLRICAFCPWARLGSSNSNESQRNV